MFAPLELIPAQLARLSSEPITPSPEATDMPSYRCNVNEVGPAVDGAETASPVVYINLTDIKGSFANTWFYAAEGAQDQMLDVAIAAMIKENAVDVVAAAPTAGGPYTKVARIH